MMHCTLLHVGGTDAVIKHVTDIDIPYKKSKLVSLRNPPKKGFYMLAFDYWFSYDDHDPRVWCDILNFEVDRRVYFNHIYDGMLTKNESDLIWKIRHGTIPTGRFLYGRKYWDSSNCKSLIRKLTPTIYFKNCLVVYCWYPS